MAGKGYTRLSPRLVCSNDAAQMSRDEVFHWLLEAKEADFHWVLSKLSDSGRDPWNVPVRKSCVKSHYSDIPSDAEGKEELALPLGDDVVRPIIQFSSAIYFVDEWDGQIHIDIIRIGDKSGRIPVSYHTSDDSAHAGVDYVAESGTVIFEPGEGTKSISVEVIPSGLWKSSTDFKVVLGLENSIGAALGQYLFVTRVKLIDDTTFPSDHFADVVWNNDEVDVPRSRLFLEYCWMNFSLPKVRSATIKWILVDWVHILSETLELFISVYLLDFILNTKRPVEEMLFVHDRHRSLLVLAGIRFVLFFLLYALDYSRTSFGLLGTSKNYLKDGLLRTFMNYSKEVREKLHSADILMAMERDVDKVVEEGYVNLLNFAFLIGRIFSKVMFVILSPYVFNKQADLRPVYFLLGLPVVLVMFLQCRWHTVQDLLEARQKAETQVSNDITITVLGSDLIFGYSLRNFVYHRFSAISQRFNRACLHCVQMKMNNNYFAEWTTFMGISLYTFGGGIFVINGQLSVGMFVANLRIFQSVGDAFIDIYDIMATMQRILPSMLFIAKLLNLPTEISLRKESAMYKRIVTEEQRSGKKYVKNMPRLDQLPIKLDLDTVRLSSTISTTVNLCGNITINQGQVVAVIGEEGSGKTTLLQLISNTFLSDSTVKSVFIPAHLRVVNVSEHLLFIAGTLRQNLTFGISDESPDIRDDRIIEILRDDLHMDDRVLQYLNEDHEHKWHEMFSMAQCRLLMIARALIFNAELITFHKPLNGLSAKSQSNGSSPSQIERVLYAFKEHVAQKGLRQKSKIELRRPRTLIFSSNHDTEIIEKTASYIIELSPMGMAAQRSDGGIS